MLAVFTRALVAFDRRRAREHGIVGRGGAVTAIQRCGSALNTSIHFHTLVAEGVFEAQSDGSQCFVAAPDPPPDVEVARLLVGVRQRIVRLLCRHGIDLDTPSEDADALSLQSPVLAALRGASIVGRVATGPRAGHMVLRLGADPTAPVVSTGGPRYAHLAGFDLHANVAMRAGDRVRLEHLCRYVLRPPVAQAAPRSDTRLQSAVALAPPAARRHQRNPLRAQRAVGEACRDGVTAVLSLSKDHGAFAPRGYYHENAAIMMDQGGTQWTAT